MTQIITGSGLGVYGSSLGLGKYGPKGTAALGQGGDSVYLNAANGNLVIKQADGFLADMGLGFNLFQTYNSLGESGSTWRFNTQSSLELQGKANEAGSYVIRIREDGHRSRFVFDPTKGAYLPEEGGNDALYFKNNAWVYKNASENKTYQYNQQGLLTSIRDNDGHSFAFEYLNGQLLRITDDSGRQKVEWTFANGLLEDVRAYSDGAMVHHLHYTYDALHRLHQVTRDLGAQKTYAITYEYAGDSNAICDIRQSDGNSLHIEYDAEGRVKLLVDAEGRISRYTYEAYKTTVTNALGEAWIYSYDEQNRLTSIEGPEQYRISYQYEGQYLSTIVQGSQSWHFSFTDAGDCWRIEESSGLITIREYDEDHHLLSETQYQDPANKQEPTHQQRTRYVYDEKGHLRFKIAADGTVKEYRYDTNGLLLSARCYLQASWSNSEENPSVSALMDWALKQNQQQLSLIEYNYDWRGQLTQEIHYAKVDAFGQGILENASRTQSQYDAAGRLVLTSKWTGQGWSTTHYLYDDLGRLLLSTDNQGHSQRFEYQDEQQRIIKTDPNDLQTIYLYDKSGLGLSEHRLKRNKDFGTISYEYDAAGRLLAETGVDGSTTYSFYDHLGRLQGQVSKSGLVSEYFYSGAGLLIKSIQYQQRVLTKAWLNKRPAFHEIRPKASAKDRISQSIYNKDNQLVYNIDARGAVISYTYNAEGQVVSTRAYNKLIPDYNLERQIDEAVIQALRDTKDRLSVNYYDNMGRLQASVNSGGYVTEYRYDRLGNLLETCRYHNPITKDPKGCWPEDKPLNSDKDIRNSYLYDGRGLQVASIDGQGYLVEFVYDESGLLSQRIAYATAVTQTGSLDMIRPNTSTKDHRTSYRYNDLGLLVEEKNQSGLLINYQYNESGQVISKTLSDAQTHRSRETCYRYDDLGRLIKKLDEHGAELIKQSQLSENDIELIWTHHSISYEYDIAGLLIMETKASGQSTRYFYNEFGQMQYSINADGAVLEMQYNTFGQLEYTRKYSAYLRDDTTGLSTSQIQTRLAALRNDKLDECIRYEYNNLGQVSSESKGNRGVTQLRYNAFGEVEWQSQRIDAKKEKITQYTYDNRGLLIKSLEDPDGLAISQTYGYDAFGRLSKNKDGSLQEYNKRGELISLTRLDSQSKKYTYDAFGRILSETNNSGTFVIKTYNYNEAENTCVLTSTLDKTTIVTAYNAFGETISITDAKGKKTSFVYDEKGQLQQKENADHSTIDYRYTSTGLLEWEIFSAGKQIQYAYDAANHLLTKTIDPKGLKICTSYQYDAIGRQVAVVDANQSKKSFSYDEQGNLTEIIVDKDGLNITTNLYYDDRGLLLRQVDKNPKGKDKVTAFEWDAAGRKIAQIQDPDALALRTSYAYDDRNNLLSITDANKHSKHFIYNVMNQCRYQIDARGVISECQYDADDNLVQLTTYSHRIDALKVYNEASLLAVLVKDAVQDQTQVRSYDAQGRLMISYDALGYATQYSYDANGNITAICQYAKAVTLNERKQHPPVLPSSAQARYRHFTYDSMNRLLWQSETNGALTQFEYDASGNVISKTQYANRPELTDYSDESIKNQLRSDLVLDRKQHYAYDAADRLIKELSPSGSLKTYEYDALGNLRHCTQYASAYVFKSDKDFAQLTIPVSSKDRTTGYQYDAAGRQTHVISSEGRITERQYDDVGNLRAELKYASNGSVEKRGNYTQSTSKC